MDPFFVSLRRRARTAAGEPPVFAPVHAAVRMFTAGAAGEPVSQHPMTNAPRKPRSPPPSPEKVALRRRLAVLAWRALALIFLALGLIGVALPVVPTVPFLIASAWAASQGWPAFEIWLLNHRLFGPPIVHWRSRGAIPRRIKWLSCAMMATSAIGMQFFPDQLPLWLRVAVPIVMLAIGVWLWRRPDA